MIFEFIYWLLSYIVPFLAVLTVIVFVHEMGHYWVARINGVAIETFSVGFGRELIGRTDRHGTRWRISAIPLGGYVRFVGDMNAASQPDPEFADQLPPEQRARLFSQKNVWQRIAVVFAGPLANIVFTFVVLYGLVVSFDRYGIDPVIDEIVAGSVAESGGLEAGDRVLAVDGYSVHGFSDFQRLVSTSPQRPVTIDIDRSGQTISLVLVPDVVETTDRFGNVHRIGRLGVSRSVAEDDIFVYRPDPLEAIGVAFFEMVFIVDRTAAFLGDFFVGRGDVEQLGGPVKVAQISGDVASIGLIALINLAALLSLNIGIFNLLPIPMLDGGHLLYYVYEAVTGRPLSLKVQEMGFRVGLALVGSLMVFTLINDVF